MTLGDLLDELRTNVLRDVSTAVTQGDSGDELWTDRSLVRYINEGYFKFARRTLALRDDVTPRITRIPLVQGQTRYPLDARVVAVLSVVSSDGSPLTKSTHPAMWYEPANTARSGRGVVRGTHAGWCAPGRPMLYAVDAAAKILTVQGVPDEDSAQHTLHLRVARVPLEPLCHTDLCAELEFDEDYLYDILEWAAFRALRNHDTDAENMAKASAHKTRFNQAVEETQVDIRRQMFQPIQFEPNTDWG